MINKPQNTLLWLNVLIVIARKFFPFQQVAMVSVINVTEPEFGTLLSSVLSPQRFLGKMMNVLNVTELVNVRHVEVRAWLTGMNSQVELARYLT